MFPYNLLVIASSLNTTLAHESFRRNILLSDSGGNLCVRIDLPVILYAIKSLSQRKAISARLTLVMTKQTHKWIMAQTLCQFTSSSQKVQKRYLWSSGDCLPVGKSGTQTPSTRWLYLESVTPKISMQTWLHQASGRGKSMEHQMPEMLLGQDRHHFCSHFIGQN